MGMRHATRDGNLTPGPLDDATAAALRARMRTPAGREALTTATGIGDRGLERAAAQLPILASHRRAIVAVVGVTSPEVA